MAAQAQVSTNAGVSNKFKRFLREVKAELKKVSWPTKKELLSNTVVVFVSVVIISFIIWGFDFILTKFMQVIVR